MVYSVFKRKVNNRIALWIQNHGKHIPDSLFLKIVFRLRMGYKLNLKHPKTFSEKLQWLKLHDRKPEYTRMVDKYAVKEYVSGLIGEEYVIPTLGVWNRADEINWEELPNQFVLKTTHGGGSGGVVICKDKALLDKNKAIEKLNKSLAEDIYESFREWPYKDVPRRIIAEKYIDPVPMVDDLPDYKWFCFDGEPKYCQVIQDRHKKETIDIFDANWLHQDFIGLNPVAENAIQQPQRPKNLDDHLRIARELSKGIPFARIDLYETNDNTFFGEITLYPASGMGSFRPDDHNYLLGKMLSLPGENGGGGNN